jgi:two-component system chemotaxis response regulator CheB
VDHCLSLSAISALLTRLAAASPQASGATPDDRVRHEQELTLQTGNSVEHMEAIGRPSTFACPDCHGTLWEVLDTDPQRYRCHTGHGFTERTLQHTMALAGDEALYNAQRALQERKIVLREMTARYRAKGDATAAEPLESAVAKLEDQQAVLLAMKEKSAEPIE